MRRGTHSPATFFSIYLGQWPLHSCKEPAYEFFLGTGVNLGPILAHLLGVCGTRLEQAKAQCQAFRLCISPLEPNY